MMQLAEPLTVQPDAPGVLSTGSAKRMQEIALAAVQKWPGRTSNELEFAAGYHDGQLRKRLVELERGGFIKRGRTRASAISGKSGATWLPVLEPGTTTSAAAV